MQQKYFDSNHSKAFTPQLIYHLILSLFKLTVKSLTVSFTIFTLSLVAPLHRPPIVPSPIQLLIFRTLLVVSFKTLASISILPV